MAGEYRFDEISSGGRWMRLNKEGDECRVMIVVDPDDRDLGAVAYPLHWTGQGQLPVDCTKRSEGACRFCDEGDKPSWRMAITVYDLDSRQRRILDGFPAMWLSDLKDVLEEWDVATTGLKIKRKGQAAQTRRNITPFPAPDDAVEAVAALSPFPPEELHQPRKATDQRDMSDPGPGDDDEMPF